MSITQFALTCLLGRAGPEWIQAATTVVLVAVTVAYVWTTHKMAKATERMATENERLRKEGEQAALLYLLLEAKMNWNLLYRHYESALKGANVNSAPLVRFSVSGTEVIAKVMAYLRDVVEIMLESYLGMRRVNALIEEYYASTMHQQRHERLLTEIPKELKRLDSAGEFRKSMDAIVSGLEGRLQGLA